MYVRELRAHTHTNTLKGPYMHRVKLLTCGCTSLSFPEEMNLKREPLSPKVDLNPNEVFCYKCTGSFGFLWRS